MLTSHVTRIANRIYRSNRSGNDDILDLLAIAANLVDLAKYTDFSVTVMSNIGHSLQGLADLADFFVAISPQANNHKTLGDDSDDWL